MAAKVRTGDVERRGHRKGVAGAAFGLWKKKAIDGVEYQRRLREEW